MFVKNQKSTELLPGQADYYLGNHGGIAPTVFEIIVGAGPRACPFDC